MSQENWAPGGVATLYLVGAIMMGIFAFMTGQVGPDTAPILGVWILGVSVPLLMLGVIDLRRGDLLFGTIGMVFGALVGLSASLAFIITMWIHGLSPLNGWWLLGTGIIFFLLIPAIQKVSKSMSVMFGVEGVSILSIALGIIGVFGSSSLPLTFGGCLSLIFGFYCWYAATAQLVNAMYKKAILPL